MMSKVEVVHSVDSIASKGEWFYVGKNDVSLDYGI